MVKCIVTLLLSIFNIYFINGQYIDWTDKNFPGSAFINIIEKDGNLIGAVSNGPLVNYFPNYLYQLVLYNIDVSEEESTFSFEEIVTIPSVDNFSTIAIDFIKQTQKWILIQASYISPGRYFYRVQLYDDSYNLITSQTIDTLGVPISFHIDTNDENTYIIGSLTSPPRDEILFLKYNYSYPDSLPEIIVKQSEPESTFWITSMVWDEMQNGMLIFHYSGIALLDTNLIQLKDFDYEQIGTFMHGSVDKNISNYYSHGATPQAFNGYRSMVINKYDTLFTILAADSFGILKQDNYPFIFKSLDIRNEEIMVGGHLDGPASNFNFISSKKKFYIAKYNETLNRLWYKEYGGDRGYLMVGVHILKDSKCLAYGFVTDTLSERNAYIIIFDSNGDTLSTSIIPPKPSYDVRLFSSSIDELKIINPNLLTLQINVFSSNGIPIIHKNISDYVNIVSIESLAIGLYFYELIHYGKIIEQGKWIKGR